MGSRDEELGHNVELTADLVNSSVELKFFPEAPAEKDAVNRVSWSFQSLIWHYLLCVICMSNAPVYWNFANSVDLFAFTTFLFGTFRNVAMIELSWKLQFLVQTSYNSEFYCAKVTKKARVYYAL